MNARLSTRHLAPAALAAALVAGLAGPPVRAQGPAPHASLRHGGEDLKRSTNVLVQAVREATERFKDVAVAEAEGYALMFGCVSGPDSGAMGLHYVNLGLVTDGVLDPARPEIVIYEPLPNGRLKLTGADFLVCADQWNAANTATPQLMGQLLHLFESPNRYGLPPFYTLHVWAWKPNANGSFVNWHPNVSCDAYQPAP